MLADTKDWTWVLERPCDECGVDVSRWTVSQLPAALHDNAMAWGDVLRREDAAVRPRPDVWSPLEYACHVRDVHRVMAGRVRLLLAEDGPVFESWDQDVTAVEERYAEQDPRQVDAELVEAAGEAAGVYGAVRTEDWLRQGTRSNGSAFTVLSLGRYHLHDVLHHQADVGLPVPHAPGAAPA